MFKSLWGTLVCTNAEGQLLCNIVSFQPLYFKSTKKITEKVRIVFHIITPWQLFSVVGKNHALDKKWIKTL